jgi:CheY-like chemotaxis protein
MDTSRFQNNILAGEIKMNSAENNIVEPNWENKTVLIVEDDDINYFYLREILEETNVQLIYADNGFKAIDVFKANPKIDLVLMDMKMPLMNGYDATSKIKAIRPYVPVVAQTAYALSGERKKSLDAGCDGYITKPIMPNALIAALSKYLG